MVLAEGGLLALPDEATPTLTVFEAKPGTWMAEDEEGSWQVFDREPLRVGDALWTLRLPLGHEDRTVSLERPEPHVHDTALHFRVSGDEEHVEIDVVADGAPRSMPNRAHHYTLLTLARARLEDTHLALDEQGWRDAITLQHQLGLPERVFNLHVFRARRQLGTLGVQGAAGLIERRRRSGEIRIGVPELDVKRL